MLCFAFMAFYFPSLCAFLVRMIHDLYSLVRFLILFLLPGHRHVLKPYRHRTIIPVILIPVCGEHHIFLEL